jgi:hypothetical protein
MSKSRPPRHRFPTSQCVGGRHIASSESRLCATGYAKITDQQELGDERREWGLQLALPVSEVLAKRSVIQTQPSTAGPVCQMTIVGGCSSLELGAGMRLCLPCLWVPNLLKVL